jgi:hypothetical protein
MAFTAHNVQLDDGTQTYPESGFLQNEHPLFKACGRLLKKLYGPTLAHKTLLDLGCLEGGYTVEFARLGLWATGLEVRQSNFDNCMIVKNGVNLPYLRFVKDDCWNMGRLARFNIVFCCGLLYHLDRPKQFIDLMASRCSEMLVLDTHFATETDTIEHALSPLVENDGLRGRWFVEYDQSVETKNENAKWTAWDNRQSFWPLKSELVRALAEAGFSCIYEIHDSLTSVHHKQRTTLAAIR